MQILKAGLLYFAHVFGAGFALGPVRILWAAPRFGTRTAELMETPLMFVIIFVAAGWVLRRLALPPNLSGRLGMGCIALGSCWSLSLRSCSGFGDFRSVGTLQIATLYRERFTM